MQSISMKFSFFICVSPYPALRKQVGPVDNRAAPIVNCFYCQLSTSMIGYLAGPFIRGID
jgi:hypothetical protein